MSDKWYRIIVFNLGNVYICSMLGEETRLWRHAHFLMIWARLLALIHSPGSPLSLTGLQWTPGPWFNIKMSSCQYRKSHCGYKTVVRSSYLHSGISYTGKITSLYWIGALVAVYGTHSQTVVKLMSFVPNCAYFPDFSTLKMICFLL